ncbi:ATP-binding cassette domain-containing protein [bacterium]|nr:MAG: ATP-binding cassette domain-containing protein [bacterium]
MGHLKTAGGERQRISVARAFLKDAPILILDEPTSSVDLETESVIMEAIDRLTRNRTAFLITHHLTRLVNCSVRLEIEDSRVSSLISSASAGAVNRSL